MTDALPVLLGIAAFNLFLVIVLLIADRLISRDPLERLWRLPEAPDRSPECDWRALEAASRAIQALPVIEPSRWPS